MSTSLTGSGVCRSISMLLLVWLFVAPASASLRPELVSPGARDGSATTESRCPTFNWSGIPNAAGYRLAIFHLSAVGEEEPSLVMRVSLPADARGWTLPADRCLERGERYAWSIAAAAGDSGPAVDWAETFLFEVSAGPKLDELEQAVATIQRFLEEGGDVSELGGRDSAPASERRVVGGARQVRSATDRGRLPVARDASPRANPPGSEPTGPGVVRIASTDGSPDPGTASLTVADQIHLGAESHLVKEGALFLWEDAEGNLALGRNALVTLDGFGGPDAGNVAIGREALQNTNGQSSAATGSNNTALGDRALRANTTGDENVAVGFYALTDNTTGADNTACGAYALTSNTTGFRHTAVGAYALRTTTFSAQNTAVGHRALEYTTTGGSNTATGNYALRDNTSGSQNTATGVGALSSNLDGLRNSAFGVDALQNVESGDRNVAFGSEALHNTTSGDRNTALGDSAGFSNTTGSDSIFIKNIGAAADTATIKIGTQGTQTTTFIAGIRGVTTANADAITVRIDSAGQLGTVSSSRELKQDIQDVGSRAERLFELRPVAFRYKQHVASDPETPLQFGLIAEEVAEVFPELVVYDEAGKPETVKYHHLSSLLLVELQRHDERVRALEDEVRELRIRAGVAPGVERAPRSGDQAREGVTEVPSARR